MFDNILSGAIQDENKIDNKNDTVIKGGAVSVPFSVSASDNDNKDNINDLDGSTGGASDALPLDFVDVCKSIIENFAKNEIRVDMQKAAQSQWSAACMLIGQYVKANQLNIDKQKTAKRNSKTINADAVAAMVDPWAFLCSYYHKTPLIFDFMRFADVSESWLYDKSGHNLTSSGGAIYKKVLQFQEYGVAADLTDGRKNPTGLIFLSKAKMGWSDSGTLRADAMQETEKNQGLPDLAALMLPKMDEK